jgi:hypothetical protein
MEDGCLFPTYHFSCLYVYIYHLIIKSIFLFTNDPFNNHQGKLEHNLTKPISNIVASSFVGLVQTSFFN